jgi:hypothetical protein
LGKRLRRRRFIGTLQSFWQAKINGANSLIRLIFTINNEGTDILVDLPDEQPSLEAIIKASMACQFDSAATSSLSEQIKSKYGEEFYNKTVYAMAEVIKSFREILQNSMALDPESPIVPVMYTSMRGSK